MKKARADHYGDSIDEGNLFLKHEVVPAPASGMLFNTYVNP